MAEIGKQVVFVPWDEAITPCVCGLEIWWPFGVWEAKCDCGLFFSKISMNHQTIDGRWDTVEVSKR